MIGLELSFLCNWLKVGVPCHNRVDLKAHGKADEWGKTKSPTTVLACGCQMGDRIVACPGAQPDACRIQPGAADG